MFPPRCITCDAILVHRENITFCDACFSKIHFIQSSLCPCCGIPFTGADGGSHLCGDCIVSKSVYSAARAVGQYETTLLEAIRRFEYSGRISTGEILGKLMAEFAYPAFNIRNYFSDHARPSSYQEVEGTGIQPVRRPGQGSV
ncbi:MAG: double zinc ribbon domain-containing protein [Syntrophales bacterium]